MFGVNPPPSKPLSKMPKVYGWKTKLRWLREELDWLITEVMKPREGVEVSTVCGYHLNNSRMIIGLIIRELDGGNTPYSGAEYQRRLGNTREIPMPVDKFDRIHYKMPDDNLEWLDMVRSVMADVAETLAAFMPTLYVIDSTCGDFMSRARIEMELARSWIGHDLYPQLRDVAPNTPDP